MKKTKETPQPSLFDAPAPVPPASPPPAASVPPPPAASKREVLKVGQLAERLRVMLEGALPSVWVEGEISNFRNPAGHWYFTLKDADAQLPCVMFKSKNYLVRPQPKDGDSVLLRGQVSFYAAQGKAQLVVAHLEPAGEGALLRAFEELKKKLAAEGLFDPAAKRPIPEVPRGIGLITSPTGAALQDILTTLRRRFPLGSAYLYPVPVQGEAAAPAIVRALRELPTLAPVDVILLARGGGSLEDLWCFNDERIARAIRACPVPVVTGVGHETDFTIADFAADLRAPTPTGAAERISPNLDDWKEHLDDLGSGLQVLLEDRLQELGGSLQRLQARLELMHPGRRLETFAQRLDELDERLRNRLQARLRELRQRLQSHGQLLNSLGPRAVLERGYAIAQAADGSVLRDPAAVGAGDAVNLTLARGTVRTQVVK